MERLTIERRNLTPLVDLNPDAGLLTFTGESYPENVLAFYRPILDWLRDYLGTPPAKPVIVQVSLRYLNTSSTKVFLMILDLCQKASDAGGDIRVRWIHHPEDSLIREMGEDLHDGLTLPFEFVADKEG
jgi:hypothetical protein